MRGTNIPQQERKLSATMAENLRIDEKNCRTDIEQMFNRFECNISG